MEEQREFSQLSTLEVFCKEANQMGGEIFLYGAGMMLYDALPCMEQCGLKVKGILDRDPQKWGTSFQGIPIYALEDVKEQLCSSAVAITTEKYAREITCLLEQYLPTSRIFHTALYPIGAIRGESVLRLRDYLNRNLDRLYAVRELLEDDLSKTVLDTVLDSWLCFQCRGLSGCVTEPQYFIPEIKAKSQKFPCFVDIGAYNGDTVEEALHYLPGIEEVYAFEADRENYSALEQRWCQDLRVKPFRVALTDREGTMHFSTGYNLLSRTTAHCVEEDSNSTQTVPSARLDHVLEHVATKVSMIKIDVEGSEMSVLRGGIERIRRDHPILAVCVYHRNEDILEIPLWLHELVPDYRFYLRQHSTQGTDVVLYVV